MTILETEARGRDWPDVDTLETRENLQTVVVYTLT